MTDTEWQAIAPLLPWTTWLDGNGGRPEEYCRRLVIDAICYVADNGNKWRNLPVDYGRSRGSSGLCRRLLRRGLRRALGLSGGGGAHGLAASGATGLGLLVVALRVVEARAGHVGLLGGSLLC
ncbi:transposase [Streptomyces sp. NPDC056165]|uniref:transposase n=1 Tax=Streptomyces sp. NPDC056165 TaxID=3345733 RepID=UPI0035DC7615